MKRFNFNRNLNQPKTLKTFFQNEFLVEGSKGKLRQSIRPNKSTKI
jgi:hypothetical protein